MASTFSPDLRIELIGAGEQPGVWGATTNTNLGTLIEDAIAGYISISVTSANQAFTANNGAADQARNATIALTTTTGAAFAVYAPPAAKQYVIYNTTAHAATVYNSTVLGNTTAAGLGAVVPAGKKLAMFSDGTNFRLVEQVDFAGVLPVVNGGTGVTSSTGTGSVVLSTSPTLVTPALGTPASGTLDNCTSSTETPGTSNTQLATTAFVQAAVSAGGFASGTVMMFVQTAAPTGWTKSTTHNDKALRVVSGTASSGGTTAFSTVFANQTPTITTSGLSAGATTLTTAQIPSHTHTLTTVTSGSQLAGGGCFLDLPGTKTTAATGGGGSHVHTVTGAATSSAITLAVQYVDVIIASKD